MQVNWRGVIPAMTTPLGPAGEVDHAALARHAHRLVDAGCVGLVPLGSLGEGATLSFDEKCAVLDTVLAAVGAATPVIPGVAALSTAEGVRLARMAEAAGCSGLMVLPPYVYSTDWREMKAHVGAVIAATPLPVLLYNNPPAYRTDFLPEQIAELAADHPNLAAVKESSADVRRIAAIRAILGDRLDVLVGVDDLIVEGVQAGAVGWIAGLVNAFPRESVVLFDLAVRVREGRGDHVTLQALYEWFLPLLRMDTVPKFVQLIKLAQALTGTGSARVRPPRLQLAGAELASARDTILQALASTPEEVGDRRLDAGK